MLARPHRLIGVAVVLAAVLWPAAGPAASVAPADAPLHEGSRVALEGVVTAAWPRADGKLLLTVARDGVAVPVLAAAESVPPRGAWIRAEGPLLRSAGELRLLADEMMLANPPELAETALHAMVRDPERYVDRMLLVSATVDEGALTDGKSRLALAGTWPEGPATLQGVLDYRPACACYVFHPWS